MPGLAMDELNKKSAADELSVDYTPHKENSTQQGSPRSPFSSRNIHSGSIDLAIYGLVDTSIEPLYRSVCELLSSDQSPSRVSFYSYGEESRIDSELRYLAGDFADLEIAMEVVIESKEERNTSGSTSKKDITSNGDKSTKNKDKNQSARSTRKSKNLREKPPIDNRIEKNSRRANPLYSLRKQRNLSLFGVESQNGIESPINNPDVGPFLLKQMRNDLYG